MFVNSASNSSGDVTQLKSKRASAPMLRQLKNVRNSFIKRFSFHGKKNDKPQNKCELSYAKCELVPLSEACIQNVSYRWEHFNDLQQL